jgi:DNA-binding CsgD family transcriptional regulator
VAAAAAHPRPSRMDTDHATTAPAGTRGAPLLERAGELARLDAVLAEARGGEGRLVVVEGPAGIGKTGLLDQARSRAADSGFHVLHARGGELERDFGLGIVRQLLEPALAGADDARRAELLTGAAGLAGAVLGPSVASGPPAGDAAHAALHGLYWLTVNLSERAPLLVVVDDLQWVDGPSLRFLHHLVRRLDGLPVAVLGGRRSGEASIDPHLLDALVLEAEVLRPAPLSGDAVAGVVRGRLGDGAGAELCDACHEGSRGNPFFLGELLRELADDGREAPAIDPAAVRALGPARIATAVLLRVGRLGAQAQALARGVAVFGQEVPLADAAALAGVDIATAGRLADALTALGVLAPGRPLGFVHPVVRTAIHRDIPASERAGLHRRAADVLAAEPEQAAAHLLATEPAGDERVVEILRAAGRGAQARGAAESALAYLRRALAEPPGPATRSAVTAELALAAFLQGQPDAANLLEEAFASADDPPTRALIGASLALRLRYDESGERDEQRADAVLEGALEGLDDPRMRVLIEAMLLDGVGTRRIDSDRLRRARAMAAELPDAQARPLLVIIASDVVLSSGTAAEAVGLCRRALGDGELIAESVAAGQAFAHLAVLVMTWAGDYEAAERTGDEVIRAFRAVGSVVPAVNAVGWRSVVRWLRGDLAAAESDARLCLEAPAGAWAVARACAAAALTGVLVERGRLTEAREVMEAMDGGGYVEDSVVTQHLRASRALLLAAEGRHREALDELAGCARVEREGDLATGVCPVGWRSAAALSHFALGDGPEARRLAGEEVALARRFGAPRALGVALRAQALVNGGDPDILAEAVDVLASSGGRLEHARAVIDLGAARRRAGARTAARATLTEGVDLAHRCGATALVERGMDELRLAGARPRRIAQAGRDGLTPAELRVAELAATGLTNKEIAQALFVTRRTVEIHLSHCYRKLGIGRREDLPAALSPG